LFFSLNKVIKTFIGERDEPAISSKISHVSGFQLATLASTQTHAVVNTNLQKRFYTTACCGKLVIMDNRNHMNLAFEDIYPIRDEIIDWLEGNKVEEVKLNGRQ